MKYVNDVRIVFIIIVIVGFSFVMMNPAEAFIEIKKAYEINSDKVCGDKLCDETETKSHQTRKNKDTPLGQFKIGIPIDKIKCKQGLEFIIKSSTWHPACVKAESVEKLTSMGWAVHSSELNNIFVAIKQKVVSQFEPLVEYQKEYPKPSGIGMEINPDVVGGKLYLVFDGFGWHGFHNVEITISNDNGISEFVMSQTSEDGDLYLPWQVPDYFTTGLYDISATDGINQYEIRIPIAAP